MSNKLINETSPYLLQHAHNPVNWYPWGNAAFELAAAENKPVLISIGYATCHWCHVMERESFENTEIAGYMNDHFICIKVDREEHPDVDHFYMDALMAMQQSGGWPLNIFVTPQRQPFYGGTYFPPQRIYNRASWLEVLEAVKATWQHKQTDIQHQAQQLLQYLTQSYQYESATETQPLDIDAMLMQIERQYDDAYGGFNRAPKFPQFSTLKSLNALAKWEGAPSAKAMVLGTLKKMLTSGIYDIVGGGICRYATDEAWKVPHFEKMLYDNALLLSTLAQAYTLENAILFKHTFVQTLHFCDTHLEAEGLYKSAIDADSEGVEGKYYVWTWEELQQLTSFNEMIADFFDCNPEGNWEHGYNILHQVKTTEELLETYQLLPKQWAHIKQQFILEAYSVRAKRIPPITDTKILLHQNALLATAIIQAYKSLGNEDYKDKGLALVEKLLLKFKSEDGSMYLHQSGSNKPDIANLAKLDDLVYLLQAIIQAYSLTATHKYRLVMEHLTNYILEWFSDDQDIMCFYSDKRQMDILVRKVEVMDGAMLSSNAVLCENLWWAGQMFNNLEWTTRAKRMMETQNNVTQRFPLAHATWIGVGLRIALDGGVVYKNSVVTSFEHFLFYSQFMDKKLLVEDFQNTDKEAILDSSHEDLDENLFTECLEGYCKMPVKSVFQLF